MNITTVLSFLFNISIMVMSLIHGFYEMELGWFVAAVLALLGVVHNIRYVALFEKMSGEIENQNEIE